MKSDRGLAVSRGKWRIGVRLDALDGRADGSILPGGERRGPSANIRLRWAARLRIRSYRAQETAQSLCSNRDLHG
jgi:hypothetical protein